MYMYVCTSIVLMPSMLHGGQMTISWGGGAASIFMAFSAGFARSDAAEEAARDSWPASGNLAGRLSWEIYKYIYSLDFNLRAMGFTDFFFKLSAVMPDLIPYLVSY